MTRSSRKISERLALFAFFFLTASAQAQSFQDHPPSSLPPLIYEDAEGQQHALSDLRGQFVLLNLWATWCAACAGEMKSLDSLQAQVSPNLAVLPLAQNQSDMTVGAFYQAHGLRHLPIALDKTGRASSILGIKGLPTTLLIDKNGKEIARVEGDLRWDSEAIQNYLRQKMSR